MPNFVGAEMPGIQHPYEQTEDAKYFSGYDDQVHEGELYPGSSIGVCPLYIPHITFRLSITNVTYAEHLRSRVDLSDFPEHIDGMVQGIPYDYIDVRLTLFSGITLPVVTDRTVGLLVLSRVQHPTRNVSDPSRHGNTAPAPTVFLACV